jgi:hypothetical protein
MLTDEWPDEEHPSFSADPQVRHQWTSLKTYYFEIKIKNRNLKIVELMTYTGAMGISTGFGGSFFSLNLSMLSA